MAKNLTITYTQQGRDCESPPIERILRITAEYFGIEQAATAAPGLSTPCQEDLYAHA